MKLPKVLGLEIGRIPRVAGTISTRSCMEAFSDHCKNLCDLAEVRLDEIGVYDGWETACREIENAGTPVILTLRSANEGGKCDRSEGDRLSVLRKALGCASIVDVEHSGALVERIAPEAEAAAKTLLVSHHDFSGTPARQFIERIIADAGRHASIVKISTMIKSDADLSVLREVLQEPREIPLCLIGMGAMGAHTRTSFPCLGSCLTYGYLDIASAPGQLSARDLVGHLRQVHPAYNSAFIIRHETMECV